MSDLDKWWYWVEPAGDISKTKAARHIFMKGFDIVSMIRSQDGRYDDISDEQTLEDFLVINWCSESPPIRELWGLKNDGL